MPYLSSTPLNPMRKGTQDLVRNTQKLHAVVRGVVPPDATGRVLWRLEEQPHKYDLLILSPEFPTLDNIVEEAGWPGAEHGVSRVADLEPLVQQVAVGREFAFKTTLNPVTSTRATLVKPTAAQARKLEEEGRSVRVAHRTVQYQLQWFVDRSAADRAPWGFAVAPGESGPNVRITSRRHLRFRKPSGGSPVSIDAVTYEGVLTVTDRQLFLQSLTSGIGKAKAYGCGLLTLAPVR